MIKVIESCVAVLIDSLDSAPVVTQTEFGGTLLEWGILEAEFLRRGDPEIVLEVRMVGDEIAKFGLGDMQSAASYINALLETN